MSPSKKAQPASRVGIVSLVALAAVTIIAGLSWYRARASSAATPQAAADPAQHLRLTLDPNLFVGDVKKAYQAAERDPALFAQLYCYCGCDRTDGHKNLLDCYRDTHGSHCAICSGEALEAEKLASQGMPIEKIREALRDRFAHGE